MKSMFFPGLLLLFCLWNHSGSRSHQVLTSDSLSVCPAKQAVFLPDSLVETSGLMWFDNLLWTINDSGHDPIIYGFRSSDGTIIRTVVLENARNVDWEEISCDSNWVYVGDIGNNSGIRTDLCFYRIPLDNLKQSGNVTAQKISFRYADQHDWVAKTFKNHWDAEAFLVQQDTIFLFTKDWIDEKTCVYAIPAVPGNYNAIRIGITEHTGLITGAAWLPDRSGFMLCGYSHYQPFIWWVKGSYPARINNYQRTYFSCDSIYGTQTEGICLQGNNLWISAERSIVPQILFHYLVSQFKNQEQK